jgi:hypothetical protein
VREMEMKEVSKIEMREWDGDVERDMEMGTGREMEMGKEMEMVRELEMG